jgi:hypothetical protein
MTIYTEVLSDNPESQKALKHCWPAERLTLDRSSDSPPDTIIVKRKSGDTIGFLENEVSAKVAPYIEKDFDIETMVLLVKGGGFLSRRQRHCYVKITI